MIHRVILGIYIIYHAVENPCEASNCSHICLLNDLEDGFSCVCAEGYGGWTLLQR